MIVGLSAATPVEARSSFLQCAPFARQISGIQLFGRAANWWAEAVGRYTRGSAPKVGAVLSFASTRAMPAGHVAMVSKVLNAREVLITHANWSYRGGIERDVRAVDVSPSGDWSMVKVWYGPTGDVGMRGNAANGFIYPAGAAGQPETIIAQAPADAKPVMLASLN
ncbi:MAG: CHAP domain-containing protein [Sphingobium sp.]